MMHEHGRKGQVAIIDSTERQVCILDSLQASPAPSSFLSKENQQYPSKHNLYCGAPAKPQGQTCLARGLDVQMVEPLQHCDPGHHPNATITKMTVQYLDNSIKVQGHVDCLSAADKVGHTSKTR